MTSSSVVEISIVVIYYLVMPGNSKNNFFFMTPRFRRHFKKVKFLPFLFPDTNMLYYFLTPLSANNIGFPRSDWCARSPPHLIHSWCNCCSICDLQMKTKRSVWNEMDIKVVMMGQPGSVEVQKFSHALISIYLVLAFTPFVTFLIVNVAAEKEHRLKDTMTMMGLYDTAFWWGRKSTSCSKKHVYVCVMCVI